MPATRAVQPTIRFVDEYCQLDQDLVSEVRSFEAFKFLHWGLISEIQRKSLPAIAKAVGLDNQPNLHHFLTESPWKVQQFRQRRLAVILKVRNGRSMLLLIDETGDCKKGKSTDYVKRQSIGNVGKKDNGIVAVTAYGVVDGMILPLTVAGYKPRERLKAQEASHSQPQIAATMMRQLQSLGLVFELVRADRLSGESKVNFVNVLDALKLPDRLAIRSHHALWLPPEPAVTQEPWQAFKRTLSNGTAAPRDMAAVIEGKRHRKQYWLLTTAPNTLPANSTAFGMVAAPFVKLQEIGASDGLRTWLEYGLKPANDA